jgi:hypothetical protein
MSHFNYREIQREMLIILALGAKKAIERLKGSRGI